MLHNTLGTIQKSVLLQQLFGRDKVCGGMLESVTGGMQLKWDEGSLPIYVLNIEDPYVLLATISHTESVGIIIINVCDTGL